MKSESRGWELGTQLVERIKSGEFPKNHLMNHGENFIAGAIRTLSSSLFLFKYADNNS